MHHNPCVRFVKHFIRVPNSLRSQESSPRCWVTVRTPSAEAAQELKEAIDASNLADELEQEADISQHSECVVGMIVRNSRACKWKRSMTLKPYNPPYSLSLSLSLYIGIDRYIGR